MRQVQYDNNESAKSWCRFSMAGWNGMLIFLNILRKQDLTHSILPSYHWFSRQMPISGNWSLLLSQVCLAAFGTLWRSNFRISLSNPSLPPEESSHSHRTRSPPDAQSTEEAWPSTLPLPWPAALFGFNYACHRHPGPIHHAVQGLGK